MNEDDGVKRINPLEGMLDTLSVMRDQILGLSIPGRDDAFTDEIGDQTVDTVCSYDTHEWETGIHRDGKWIIVEQYPSREEAVVGHEKWVAAITATPEMELKDIDIWGLGL